MCRTNSSDCESNEKCPTPKPSRLVRGHRTSRLSGGTGMVGNDVTELKRESNLETCANCEHRPTPIPLPSSTKVQERRPSSRIHFHSRSVNNDELKSFALGSTIHHTDNHPTTVIHMSHTIRRLVAAFSAGEKWLYISPTYRSTAVHPFVPDPSTEGPCDAADAAAAAEVPLLLDSNRNTQTITDCAFATAVVIN